MTVGNWLCVLWRVEPKHKRRQDKDTNTATTSGAGREDRERDRVQEIKYPGMILDRTGKWNKERKQVETRERIASNGNNACKARETNTEV